MFLDSVRKSLIHQKELKKQTDQACQVAHSKNVSVPILENNNSTTWRQYLLLGLSKILVASGQWLRSPNQLSF